MPLDRQETRKSVSRSLRDRLVGGGSWAATGKIGVGLTQLAAIGWIARLLSPQATAVFFLAQSLVAFGAMMGRLGLELTAVRLVSQALGRGDRAAARASAISILRTGAGGALLAGTLLALGGAAWAGQTLLDAPRLADLAPALGVWTFGLALHLLLAEVFRGFHAIRETMIWGGLASNLLVLAGLAAIAHKDSANLETIVWIWAASALISAAVAAAILTARLAPLPPTGLHLPATVQLLAIASPLLVSNLMGFILLRADLWFVSAFSSAEEVAAYGAAARLASLVGLPLVVANQVVAPLIGDLHARGESSLLERLVRGVAGAVAAPAAFLTGAYILFGGMVLGVVYGPFFERASLLLSLLSIAQLSMVLTGSCGLALVMTGHQRAFMSVMIAAAAVLLLSCPIAARAYGATGVATTACAVVVAQQFAMLLLARRLTRHWTHASFRHLSLGIAALISRSRHGDEVS